MRVATDIGGTFTDLVSYDPSHPEKGFVVAKTDTTPPEMEHGVFDVLRKGRVPLDAVSFFAHGTTVVINAITERKGVKTALITTRGFRDVLEIGRCSRPDLYNLMYHKPPAFVRRHLRLEVGGRMNYQGQEIEPLDLSGLPDMLDYLKSKSVGAVAVCLLHAYANPEHEIALEKEISRLWPEVTVATSHEIIREWREYERMSTTVLSAMVQPIVENYLDQLGAGLAERGLSGVPFIMRSNGGIDTVGSVKSKPIAMLESGPASGVLGAAALGKLIGEENIIALDVGGTTAKCSLIDSGRVRITTKTMIEHTKTWTGYPILTPSVDLVEIGNGGGSIARVDEFGKMHVGPQSAGADPGPVAYGRGGTKPTTTDAHLMTGRIDPENFHGGEFVADMEKVEEAFNGLASELALDAREAARGVIRIANSNMINALKLVSVNRGYDPRDFTLVAFGGGGGMHATALARELGIRKVIIPINSAVFSAWGMLLSDLRRDYVMTCPMTLDENGAANIADILSDVRGQAIKEYAADGVKDDLIHFEYMLDIRYVGQEHSLKVSHERHAFTQSDLDEIVSRFHENYEREYTYRLDSPLELVGIHVVAFGHVDKPDLPKRPEAKTKKADAALTSERKADFDEMGFLDAGIYDRSLLEPGMELAGPAFIEEPDTVVMVWPGQSVKIDPWGNIHVDVVPAA